MNLAVATMLLLQPKGDLGEREYFNDAFWADFRLSGCSGQKVRNTATAGTAERRQLGYNASPTFVYNIKYRERLRFTGLIQRILFIYIAIMY